MIRTLLLLAALLLIPLAWAYAQLAASKQTTYGVLQQNALFVSKQNTYAVLQTPPVATGTSMFLHAFP